MSRGKRDHQKREKTVKSLEHGLSKLMSARAYAADAIPKYEAKIERAKGRIATIDYKVEAQEDAIKEAKKDA